MATPDSKCEWLHEHISCFGHGIGSRPVNINLLLTCKQMYLETYLLPYSSNTFIFIAPASFETFVASALLPAQARALRSVAFWSPVNDKHTIGHDLSWKSWKFSSALVDERLLCGIQRLQVNLSVYESEFVAWDNVGEIRGLLGLRVLARWGLRSVEAAVGCDGPLKNLNLEGVVRYENRVREILLGKEMMEDDMPMVVEG